MKEENKEKGKGFYENRSSLYTNKKGKPVAPEHQENANKAFRGKMARTTGRTSIVPSEKIEDTEDQNIISLNFNIKEKDFPMFTEANEEYMEKNDIVIETEAEGDDITIRMHVENVEDFVNFIGEKGFELSDEEEEQVNEIIEKDDTKTSKENSDKNPNKSDSKGSE